MGSREAHNSIVPAMRSFLVATKQQKVKAMSCVRFVQVGQAEEGSRKGIGFDLHHARYASKDRSSGVS
jgi:hypothetical protein